MVATIDVRLMTEEDEAIATPPGLRRGCPPGTQQSAIGKKGGGGGKEDNEEEDRGSFWRMPAEVAAAPAKRRRVQ